MKYNPVTRRMFLQGVGGSLLAIPFLESLLPSVAWAADPTIRRYIGVFGNYDYGHPSNWFPTSLKPAMSFKPSTGEHTMHYAPMSSFIQGRQFSRIIVPELNPFMNQLTMFRSLDFPQRMGHGNAMSLGNVASAVNHGDFDSLPDLATIDQVLAYNINFNPKGPNSAPVLNMRHAWSHGSSWGPDGTGKIVLKPLTGNGWITNVYNEIFNNGTFPESGSQPTSVKHQRSDALTRVMEDYTRVKNSHRISSVDKILLENALDQISTLQSGLSGGQTVVNGCSHKNVSLTGDSNMTEPHFDQSAALKNKADLIVAALMCDVTRSVNFNSSPGDSYYDLNPASSLQFHHDVTHLPHAEHVWSESNGVAIPNWQSMGLIYGRFMRNFMAPLLAKMDAHKEANGQSLLYNSLVHFTMESSIVHHQINMPCLLAGSAGGNFKSGNYIDTTNYDLVENGKTGQPYPFSVEGHFSADPANSTFHQCRPGVHYNRVLVSILQSMGLQPSDYEKNSVNSYIAGRSDGKFGAINNGIANLGGYGYAASPNPQASETANCARLNLNYYRFPVPVPS